MAGLGAWSKDHGYRDGITYLIEAGDEGYDQLEHLLSYAGKSSSVTDLYQWRGHSVTPKGPNSPFHAPDTLAWEWGKFVTETALDNKRAMRMSLVSLLRDRLDRYTFQHLYGEPLLKFFRSIHALGVEQMQEDREALSSAQPVDVKQQVVLSGQSTRVGDPE